MFARDAPTRPSGILFWSVVFGSIGGLLFGWYCPRFEAQYGLPIIDTAAALRPARMLELIAAYGEAGRHAYLVFLSLDCLFPVAGSMFVLSVYRPLMDALQLSEDRQRLLTRVAAAPAVFDLIENTFYALLTTTYPRAAVPLAPLVCVATAGKYTALVLACAVCSGLVLRWLKLRSLRSSKS